MSQENKSRLLVSLLLGLILPIVVVGLGFGAIGAMGKSKPKRAMANDDGAEAQLSKFSIVSVAPTRIFDDHLSLDIDTTGYVVPYRQITVAAEVAGKIKMKSPLCQLGRFVNAGDLLFQIDPTDYEWELERLKALRESEYAQQKELEQEVANAQRALKLAEEEVALQDKEVKRIENLPKGFTSGTELDQAKRAKLASSNQRLTIQNQIDMLTTRRTRIVLAERLASTQLEQAKVNLARTQIRAPISGVIVSESVEADSYVQKGTTLCVVDDTSRVEVSSNLRPDQLTFVLDQDITSEASQTEANTSYQLPQTPVTVSYQIAGREEQAYEWQGHLSRYEGIGLDPQSRTIPIRITVDRPRENSANVSEGSDANRSAPPALVRGMFVNCKIKTNPRRNLILIPKLGLQPGNQVWIFHEDQSLSHVSAASSEASRPSTDEPQNVSGEWIPGRLHIVRNVKTIRTIRDPKNPSQEFWVVEAREELRANTLVVTSPLSAIIGDGTDKIRRQKERGASK